MNSTVYAVDEYGNEAADVRSGYVGEIKMFGFSGVPAHCLACDGSLLSIAAYPELYAKLGTQHGGDGVTTFALPTAEDVIYAAGNGRAVGAAVADGLPALHGALNALLGTDANGFRLNSPSGATGVFTDSIHHGDTAFKVVGGIEGILENTNAHIDTIDFNAYYSNPIYGASTHVQPKGTVFNFCIVYE